MKKKKEVKKETKKEEKTIKKVTDKDIEKEKKRSIINRSNILLVDIQVFLTCLVIILFIMCLFNRKYLIGVEIALFFALICMAYNNFKIYKRKFATVLYLVFALIILVLFILKVLGIGN